MKLIDYLVIACVISWVSSAAWVWIRHVRRTRAERRELNELIAKYNEEAWRFRK